uniref:Sodium/calcium exchanger membrane region domain-containing protein n=1 Tax=Acrobeloides nanus TaxID=290746 RepID=A0A914E388_9BILA
MNAHWNISQLDSSVLPTFSPDNFDNSEDVACTPYAYTSDIKYVCAYVLNQTAICEGGGYLAWTQYVVCQESSATATILIVLSLFWLFFLFFLLSLIAEEFFCKNIEVIVKKFNISQNVATKMNALYLYPYKTLLIQLQIAPLGNGAPDIFTSIASTISTDRPQAGIAISDLFGSGIFTVSIVFAIIIFIRPFTVKRIPMLRDLIFYIISVCFLGFFMFYDSQIHIWQPIVFLCIYICYALIIISGRKIVKKTNEVSTIFAIPVQVINSKCETQEYPSNFIGRLKRAYSVIHAPLTKILSLVIPCADNEWSQTFMVLHAFTALLAVLVAFQWVNVVIISDGPILLMYSLVLSVIISCFIIWFTKQNQEPKHYKIVIAFIGFIIASLVIYLVAAEVVNLLIMLGVILRISPDILAVTILAWANCIGDIVADTSIARKGFQRMAISAAVGGPLFNLLIGFGLSFLLAKLQGKTIRLNVHTDMKIMLIALLSSLFLSLVLLFVQHFRFKRFHGILLIGLYLCFLILVILAELKVLQF